MSKWSFPTGDLMKGKRGVVMGVANDSSIAWGIAHQLAAQGAEIAFTYQGENLERRVRPLVESIGMNTMIPADVTDDASMDAAFAQVKEKWGKIDFLVHSIAFAGKEELMGSMVANTSREGFRRAMDISVYSFIDCARRASELMPDGGSIICMTYLGAERTMIEETRVFAWQWRGTRDGLISGRAGFSRIIRNIFRNRPRTPARRVF